MNVLEEEYRNNPAAEALILEFSQISNLNPLLSKLTQFKNLRELSLHGNRLTTLPEDLSGLRNLELLDISNNLIQNVNAIIPGLRSLPNLRNLAINLRGREDEEQLIHALPNLETLNETPIQRTGSEGGRHSQNNSYHKGEDEPSFHSKEKGAQPKATKVPNQTKIPNKNIKKDSPPSSKQQQQPSKNSPRYEEEIGLKQEDLEAVGVLYDCIRELFKEQKPEKDKVLAEEFDDHVKNVMYDLSNKLSQKTNPVIQNTHVMKAKFALYEICFGKIIQLIGSIDPRLSSVLEGIHDAHAVIFKELSMTVNQGAKTAMSTSHDQHDAQDSERFRQEREMLIKEFEQERNELMDQIASLQEENTKYLDQIIKHSKENASQNLGHIQQVSTIKTAESEKQNKYGLGNYESFAANTNAQKNTSIMAGGSNAFIGQTSVRALTLKQLKDIIEEIYISKTKYDQRCLESKLPRETMEQHMYTYLNQKYGLKNLIIEWATAIINGIKKFSNEDNDVAVFGKILRNECDEEFRFVQSQVKETISELLKMYLRSKHPLKTNTELKEMMHNKTTGNITEEECNDIINYMYNQEDAEFLLDKLKKFYTYPSKSMVDIKRLPRDQQLRILNEKEKPVIEYFIFQKIILDFQLKSHEKFLKNFVAYFRLVDKDLNGIIDEAEFREMISYFESHGITPDVDKLLVAVDPYNQQQITFSQCVSLFSSEMLSEGEGGISILQKLSIESTNI